MTRVMGARGRPVPEAAVVDGLLGASRVLMGLAARSLANLEVDVTLVQYRALVVLAGNGPQRAVDLATELEVAPSTVTRMCDRLVRRDLVRRFQREGDRRAVWVMLTDTGRELVGTVMRHRRRAITALVREAGLVGTLPFAQALRSFVEAGGELPQPQWWRRWRTSSTSDG